jgi:septal ring factor EnvC (AmiA/AmiB activator)
MTDERITKLFGERCTDHEPSCACCVVWDMRDRIEAQAKEIAETRAANDRCEELFKQMQAEAEAQAKEIAELKAALAEYQSGRNYLGRGLVAKNTAS